jgi:hypothetical protein
MKKGLLIAIGITAGLGLAAQAPKVSGVHKVDLTNSKATTTDGSSSNFYASANAAQRNNNPNAPLTAGTRFSSSYNAFTLIVSTEHCLTADQALNAVLFTHRMSQDWAADANVGPGYLEYSWSPDFGNNWDSSYVADQTNLGNKRFRYPSGAIINPAGNTTIANATTVCAGPYTDGTNWQGYYNNYQMMVNGATQNTNILTNGQPGVYPNSFPRISMTSYDDSTAWICGGLYGNDDGTTTIAQAYRGATLMKGKMDNTGAVNWTYDSIHPNFHVAPTDGTNDCFSDAMLGFSPNGQLGYCVFFGVDGAASTPSTRSFSPIVYKTTNGGGSWSLLPINDFTTIPVITQYLIPATGGSLKPWFDQSQGADIVVDNNGQLHIVCTISSGSSDDDDSLGYTWTLTGQNGATARHYIYDVHTTVGGWDAWLVDSLMTSTSTNNTIFIDGSNAGAAFPTDARIQMSHTTDRSKLFFAWVDSDPLALAGENALPDLKAVGYDLTTGMKTPTVQFTSSQDFYFHYVSNVALVSGSTYKIGVTNSIDRNGSHDMATTFDHYWYNGCTFNTSDFTQQIVIGVNEQTAEFGSFETYPNPAADHVNVNINMVKGDDVTFTVANEIGQTVLSENRTLATGSNHVQLNTSNLPAGVYFVSVASSTGRATSKVVIQ